MKPLDHPTPTSSISSKDICIKEISDHCDEFKGAEAWRSIFQLVTTLALFTATCIAMFYSLDISYFLTLLLSLPAAGLLIRLFIFQHDCGHGSFFNSKRANDWVGRFLSVLTVTPYDFWRRAHNMHHATSGDLDRRSIGGIDTITIQEYRALPKAKQIAYRIYRNPIVLLVIGTPFYVMILQRIPFNQGTGFYENYKTLSLESIKSSILLTNLAILGFFGTLSFLIGLGTVLAIFLPILVVTAWIGGWLFYVQHQFEETYWEKNEDWDLREAALFGSSYYELPKIIQWFSGNIGLHHIHHLCSKIPNYKLQDCMDAKPELSTINKLTFIESLKCVDLKLWDEETKRLVPLS